MRREDKGTEHQQPPRQRQSRVPWWRSRWARRAAVLAVGMALGVSCTILPPALQPVCVAVVKVLHAAGVP